MDNLDAGEQLAEWRRLLNLSVKQLAERAEVSESTIARLERGEGASMENVLRIMCAMGIHEDLVAATDPWNSDRGKLPSAAALTKRAGRK